ncbi:hypothetical protein [Actinocorallia longicatena]|uniref:Uncharacterized protein n=1 Tax=Actinocorallia longicatena TaxID=111803 RepID=A0ABP6QEG2_9ACTN
MTIPATAQDVKALLEQGATVQATSERTGFPRGSILAVINGWPGYLHDHATDTAVRPGKAPRGPRPTPKSKPAAKASPVRPTPTVEASDGIKGADAAAILGVNSAAFDELVADGRLAALPRKPKEWRKYKREEVEALALELAAERNEAKPGPEPEVTPAPELEDERIEDEPPALQPDAEPEPVPEEEEPPAPEPVDEPPVEKLVPAPDAEPELVAGNPLGIVKALDQLLDIAATIDDPEIRQEIDLLRKGVAQLRAVLETADERRAARAEVAAAEEALRAARGRLLALEDRIIAAREERA